MANRTVGILFATALVVGGAGFWAGMRYAQSKTPARGAQFAQGTFAGRAGGGGRVGGAAAFGTIIAKDASSVTVQLGGPNATSTNGAETGTRIVLYNGATQIGKFTAGSPSDFSIGDMVTVNGTANSDGSLTAQSIQIRPAGSGPRPQ